MPHSNPSPTTHHAHVSAGTLAQLAAISGSEFDHERAVIAIQNAVKAGNDPLDQLAAASAEVFMRVSPLRQPLSEAVWHAHNDTPVVVWSETESRWLVVTFAGWFRLRIADGDHPTHRISVSRAELARRLGLKSIHEIVEAGIVQPERPAHSLSAHADDPSHDSGHATPFSRFWNMLHAERRDIGTLLIFSIFSGILYLAAPLTVDAVVSNLAFGGQQQPYVQALVILAIALFAALALQAVISGFQFYLSDILQRRIFVRVASDLAYRLPRVEAQALDQLHAPELVNRFLDVVTVQKTTALLLLDGINLVFGSLIGMLLLALYHPVLLLFSVILMVLIALAVWILGKGGEATSIAESRIKYDLVNWFEEIAHFPILFKGPGGYDMAYGRANQLATDYVTARGKHFRILMRQISGLLLLQVVASAVLLVIGGWLVISQQITLGQLVASEIIMSALAAALAKLGKKIEAWYDAMAAMDKLGHIFDLEIEREDGEQPNRRDGGAEVTACDLSFGYLEGVPLFTGLNFTLAPGTRAAVIGPHGSGSSSLLDILFGLRQPHEGHVSIDGLDLRSWYLEALREQVQLVRRNEIVDATVVDNLRLGRADIGMDEIRAALDRVGLLDHLLHRPEGLNLRMKLGGAPLSSNQRTRLLIARALVQRPQLLLLDGILDGLDIPSFQQLAPALFDKTLPWTVVIATRDRDVTNACNQIIQLAPCQLSDGKMP